jgi:hypothetical protein
MSTYDSVGILCFDLSDGVPTPAYANVSLSVLAYTQATHSELRYVYTLTARMSLRMSG